MHALAMDPDFPQTGIHHSCHKFCAWGENRLRHLKGHATVDCEVRAQGGELGEGVLPHGLRRPRQADAAARHLRNALEVRPLRLHNTSMQDVTCWRPLARRCVTGSLTGTEFAQRPLAGEMYSS